MDFRATAYDLIKVVTDNGVVDDALFPVDFQSYIKINENSHKVTINIDNPTALHGCNMDAGPQGTHFGYTIQPTDGGRQVLGHVLINTFIGFPTRDKKAIDDNKILFKQHGTKQFKFIELNNMMNPNYVIPYDLISKNGLVGALKNHPITHEPTFPKWEDYWGF